MGGDNRLALVHSVDSSLDALIHRHIGRYRAMLKDSGDGRVQTHINSVINTLEKHITLDHLDHPQLGSLHERYARQMQAKHSVSGGVGGELKLPQNGVFVMLKELGVNKYLVSKDEVISIFRFAAQGGRNLSKRQFLTFVLNLARLAFSRPPHNVPLDECMDVFIAKFLPKRASVLRPVRAASSAARSLHVRPEEHAIFRLTTDKSPPTLQHFSPLLRPAAKSRESRSLLRPLNFHPAM